MYPLDVKRHLLENECWHRRILMLPVVGGSEMKHNEQHGQHKSEETSALFDKLCRDVN